MALGTKMLRRCFGGGKSGMTATATMTAALAAAEVAGLMDRQPPRMIIAKLLPGLSSSATDLTAAVSHAAYGTSAGAVYSTVVPARWQNRSTGVVYGIGIWVLGYEGWLPLLGILPPAHRDNLGRAVSVFTAHVIYGYTLGGSRRDDRDRRQ